MKKSIRRSQAQIESLLQEQEISGITVTEFCKTHKIHKATFYNWRKAYGFKSKDGKSKTSRFIPLTLNETRPINALFAEIELASKVTVRLFQRVDASYFKSIIKHASYLR